MNLTKVKHVKLDKSKLINCLLHTIILKNIVKKKGQIHLQAILSNFYKNQLTITGLFIDLTKALNLVSFDRRKNYKL